METYDIILKAQIQTPKMKDHEWHTLTITNMENLYYSVAQMVTHHAVNGCNLEAGDILGTGTVSGPKRKSWASMVESIHEPEFQLFNGETRRFLEDGDKIKLSGVGLTEEFTISLGEVTGTVIPELDDSHYF